MRIALITPAPAESRSGNRTTALRWASLFEELGHSVEIGVEYAGADVDLMVALHAWRSAASIAKFREKHHNRPLVVALAGTDIYRDLERHRETVLRSLDSADALIGLHDLVAEAIPQRFRDRVAVIYQSARQPAKPVPPSVDCFEVLIVGHLRDVKDPLRAARAARLLPPESNVRILHLGRAHTPAWAAMAAEEMAENPRYEWRGEVSGAEVSRLLSRARLMVLSSVMEGGANVISEAVVAGTPILASRIDGSVGLLGPDYPGYFATGDTQGLADLLAMAENDPTLLARLKWYCSNRAPLFTPAAERNSWRHVLDRVARHRGYRKDEDGPRSSMRTYAGRN